MHWIAYTSREQGPAQVFVTPFPGPGPRMRISLAGGGSPVWRKDGSAILYVSDAGTIQETEVHERGPELVLGKPRLLSSLLVESPNFLGFPLDIARDGRIFLLSRGEESKTHLVVVANWSEGLNR